MSTVRLLVFGPGYTAARLMAAVEAAGGSTATVTRATFGDAARTRSEIARATHILSSIPPGEADPVLVAYGADLAAGGKWLGYLSSTGVYGDTGGGWVDESAPLRGRRGGRLDADRAWGLLPNAHVFRLPGIYGPERSALERMAAGATRVFFPGQVFSRVHVDDLIAGVIAAFEGPPGAYNLSDDLPAPQAEVLAYAAELLGIDAGPAVSPDAVDLSPASRAFYAENRRVANGKAKRLLGWRPRYADYRLGLRALKASTSPTSTSTPPATASSDQR
ncbi:NAD(P)-dependent oxidoreductase [Sphingomonas sp. TDK1]|uniref:NAD(P)-dependent oxidoreductase n=1 Tax=Sphingomonas sp. TDK1 TaxID=453247 RepID=UPI0009FDFEC7|nr:NAD(P)-dependent oxidoreductase [Sphingomonas sp. TDK1]